MSSTTASSSSSSSSRRTIVITGGLGGGLGNLGSKLCRHLLSSNSSSSSSSSETRTYKIILVEHPDFIDRYTQSNPLPHDDENNVIVLPCDLGNPTDEQSAALREALLGADALIHFSAVNPYPNASWSDSAQSMDHTFNIFQLAVICKGECVFSLSLSLSPSWSDRAA
jgi:nucleoside-diphosphate-sugar epimerase